MQPLRCASYMIFFCSINFFNRSTFDILLITLSGEEQCANGNKGQRCPQIIALFQSVRSINGDLFFFAARPNRDDVVDIHICFGIVRFLAQLASLFIFIIALSFTWHGS